MSLFDIRKRSRGISTSHHTMRIGVNTGFGGSADLRANDVLALQHVLTVIVDRLCELLLKNIVPLVPMRGSISASGFPESSNGRGGDVYADQALVQVGLEPVVLTAKEGLAIVNGTAMSAACATLVLHDVHQLAMLSQILTAMTVEALQGSPENFDPFFSEVRPHPGQIESARNISSNSSPT
ncbi:hypothetical protein N8T08_005497 [Aspergillus melleus]|uniref:Uncharacterized protein n=1 Tax=Aspergillus melleus TaxID=138277 RepID=A0ACC3B2I4_9EURO|nr:hypothetical protein N8T08_005497 [Aspergillus melleus]